MEKILNIFGLTTLKNAKLATRASVQKALGEKPYQRILYFTRVLRKYKFRVVSVDMEEAEVIASSRMFAKQEFDLATNEEIDFANKFIPNLSKSNDLNLLK